MDWYVVRERTLPHGSVSPCAIVEESIIYVRFGVRVRNAFSRVHCRCVALLSMEMRAKLHHIPEYTTSPGFTLAWSVRCQLRNKPYHALIRAGQAKMFIPMLEDKHLYRYMDNSSGRNVRDKRHISQLIVVARGSQWQKRQEPFVTHRYKHV